MDVGEYMRRKEREKQNKEKCEKKGKKCENITATEAINRYSSMSEEQLMQELFRVGSVSGGSITAQELDSFYNTVKNFITPEQSAKMKELIMQLKMQ